MTDRGKEGEKEQKACSPRQLLRKTPKFWPSAPKRKHTNPAGVPGVRKSHKLPEGSIKSSPSPEEEMSLYMEQLARRPLKSMCPSVGATFCSYSHATDPQRTAQAHVVTTVNGLAPPPTQIASSSCTVTQPVKRERVVDSTEPQATPSKKRMRLSLRDRSGTPVWSESSSGGSSPNRGGGGNRQSSTPPLTPVNGTVDYSGAMDSHELTAPESPIARDKRRLAHSMKKEPKAFLEAGEGSSSQQPSTPKLKPCSDDFDTTPPLSKARVRQSLSDEPDDDFMPTKPSSPQGGASPTASYDQVLTRDCHCQDMSQWGGGRLAYSCDLTSPRPFDKFALGHLENYAEMISKGGDLDNYLQTVERLVNQGFFFPANKIDEVFRVMRKCNNDQAIKNFHFCLQQDISIRTDCAMKSTQYWSKLQKCLDTLRSNKRVLLASVQLSYLLKFLVKNLDANKHELRSSLVEQLLSSRKSLNITNVLDVIFSLQTRAAQGVMPPLAEDLCPLRCLLEMISLPLLTCDPSRRSELRTKLAREFAIRLDKLTSSSTQLQLINRIPSEYLKEKVVDFVLERNFPLPSGGSPIDAAFADNEVSFAKITAVHLHRRPRSLNESPLHTLSFFLNLLISLIRTHILTKTASQPLVSLLPSSPPLPSELLTNVTPSSTAEDGAVRHALFDMHQAVLRLTERLMQEECYIVELTEPTTWINLQLLSLITSS